ncbi:MAG TPA: hypothetical protein VNE39_19805 [Planctomycetota bacterium]|nr:hypothetical protein [Planctomycetota bacterium]
MSSPQANAPQAVSHTKKVASATAPCPLKKGMLLVQVRRRDGKPLSQPPKVSLSGPTPKQAAASPQGRAQFTGLDHGDYSVTFACPGEERNFAHARVKPPSTVAVTVPEVHLVIYELYVGPRAAAAGPAVAPAATRRGKRTPHWIKVLVADEDRKPVTDVTVRVRVPDGTVHTGKPDGGGLYKVESFYDAGQCEISFPDVYDIEWKPQ